MNGKEVLKRLKKAGWVSQGMRGSHEKLIHPEHPELGTVVVPVHGANDISAGTLKNIEKQANIKF